jgi:hypothetical protein
VGTILPGLDGHEGYAAQRQPDGTLTGPGGTAETAGFTAYVAACACSSSRYRPGAGYSQGRYYTGWYGGTTHPPTEAGHEAALEEWERVHARPLQADALTDAGSLRSFEEILGSSLTQHPLATLALLRRLDQVVDERTRDAVAAARIHGASWQDIGAALGMTRQAAHGRFGARP